MNFRNYLLYNDEMTRALVDGKKTRTMRPFQTQPSESWHPDTYGAVHRNVNGSPDPSKVLGWGVSNWFGDEAYVCPYGPPGVFLYGREAFAAGVSGCPGGVTYRADHLDKRGDGPAHPIKWTPNMHMPKRHARLIHEVTGITALRVQDVTEKMARQEGFDSVREFAAAWNSIYHKRGVGFLTNPWAWSIEFKLTVRGTQ